MFIEPNSSTNDKPYCKVLPTNKKSVITVSEFC